MPENTEQQAPEAAETEEKASPEAEPTENTEDETEEQDSEDEAKEVTEDSKEDSNKEEPEEKQSENEEDEVPLPKDVRQARKLRAEVIEARKARKAAEEELENLRKEIAEKELASKKEVLIAKYGVSEDDRKLLVGDDLEVMESLAKRLGSTTTSSRHVRSSKVPTIGTATKVSEPSGRELYKNLPRRRG